jgi:competence protein ComEC
VLVAGTLYALPHSGAPSPKRFTISFLDVGQGDSTLLQSPEGGTVLVDGGPAGDHLVDKLRRFGVRFLDVVVLTHPQADHEDGLEPVLRSFPVHLLLDGGRGSSLPMHRRLVSLARDRGALVRAGRAGERLRVGDLELHVLSPADPSGAAADDDPNDRAIVLLASYRGLDVFLPADAESNVTLGLPLAPVEVVKVAHHGSADPGLADLLESLGPKLAVIEVGTHNRYGHPAPATLATLAHAVPRVMRTDRDGDVRVSLVGRGLAIASQH